jgi:HAD superfamily phosphoserine phosphatase-like hydrolase
VRERMLPSVTPAARGWIAAAARDSDATLLVSASNLFLTEAIGRGLGCDATLGTRYATRDGRFTGERLGEPCFRAGKVRHVELWLAQRGVAPAALTQARFYSDSHNDLPLLEAVAEPIAVDPDPRLRRVAEARGWPILSLGPTD